MAKTNSVKGRLALSVASFVLHILLNVIFYTVVVLLVIRLSKAAYEFAYQLYGDVSVAEAPGTDVIVEIKKGESTMELSRKLSYNRIILDEYSFFVRAKLGSGSKNPILPGKYKLNTSMDYGEIMNVITDAGANLEKPDQEKKSEKADQKSGQADQKSEKADQKSEKADQKSEKADQKSEKPDQKSEKADQKSEKTKKEE